MSSEQPTSPSADVRTKWILLAFLTLASSCGYWWLGTLSHFYQDDSKAEQQPTLIVLSLLAGLFVVHWLALWLALRLPSGKQLGLGIVASSAVFRAIVVPSTPILEIDYHRYIWDGAVLAEGVSPYRYAPEEVIQAANPQAAVGDDTLLKLVELNQKSASLGKSLRTIHYEDHTSPYPLVSQVVFAAAALITPDDSSNELRVTLMKALLTTFDLATLLLVMALLKSCGRHLGWSLAYGWCPLLLKEIANGGHLDSIAIFFCTAAVWALVSQWRVDEQDRSGATEKRTIISASLLALAIGAKLYPIVLAPLFAAVWLRRGTWRHMLVGGTVCTALTLGLLSPQVREKAAESADSKDGISAFLRRWEMNDLLFMIVRENLMPQDKIAAEKTPWFSVVPDRWSDEILDQYWLIRLGNFDNPRPMENGPLSFELARLLTGIATLGIACALAWRAARPGTECSDLVRAAFLTIAWFWLLFPAQNPWYWCWAIPFLPFARYRAWHATAALALLYYLRFWLETHYPEPPVAQTPYDGEYFFYFVVPWFEFGPLLVALAVSWFLWRKRTL